MKWILLELLFIAVQLIGFIPFYFIWRKDCLHCKSKQTGVVTFRYWCEITKVGVRPWIGKPHPKCPLKSGRAGRFES